MSKFLTPLIIEDNGDETFTLKEGFSYHIGSLENDIIINVPAGYKTDFASVPKIFWNIFPPHGKHGKSAVIHDYLYTMVNKGKFSRVIADAIFLESMEVLGVSKARRYIMYFMVRLFGGFTIKK